MIKIYHRKGCQYFWKNPNLITKDNEHWISEINFGLRIFMKAKEG